jgi:hypothetical protein
MQKIKVSGFHDLVVYVITKSGSVVLVHGGEHVNTSEYGVRQTRESVNFVILDRRLTHPSNEGRVNVYDDIVHETTGETLYHYMTVTAFCDHLQSLEPESRFGYAEDAASGDVSVLSMDEVKAIASGDASIMSSMLADSVSPPSSTL